MRGVEDGRCRTVKKRRGVRRGTASDYTQKGRALVAAAAVSVRCGSNVHCFHHQLSRGGAGRYVKAHLPPQFFALRHVEARGADERGVHQRHLDRCRHHKLEWGRVGLDAAGAGAGAAGAVHSGGDLDGSVGCGWFRQHGKSERDRQRDGIGCSGLAWSVLTSASLSAHVSTKRLRAAGRVPPVRRRGRVRVGGPLRGAVPCRAVGAVL